MASKEEIELGNYRVLKNGDGQSWELGKGAFGTTYKAEHKHLPRFCALKVINENLIRRSNAKQRFLQEAQAASLLDHPNIAQIFDFGESEGTFYYAMTYCAGHDLEHFAKAKGPQAWSSVKKMAKQIFSALVEAHGKGLLHRDIKPSNIMLTENDGTVNLKLIDFGLVKVLEQSSSHKTNVLLTNDGGFLGSPLTASPEQLNEEELDERSDLFSVGVTLWYLLVGGSPFEYTSTAQLVHQRLSADPYENDFPDDLEPNAVAILSKLLRKNKNERYASAEEVLSDLEEVNLLPKDQSVSNDLSQSTEQAETPEVDQAAEAEALKEKMEKVDADWSEIWEILSIVHQDIHGTLYNCVSKKDATVRSSIFIPDSKELFYQEVITTSDNFIGSDVKNLSPFVSRGLYDGEVCFLSTPYPFADVSLLIRQAGELGFSKYKHLFQGIANAIDEGDRLGLPGLQLSHNEIKLAFSDQPMDLTEEQWVQHFNKGSSNITDLINTLEIFIFPKFVDNKSVDDISMTLSNEDLATSTLSSFAGFIYSAVSGMKVKQSVYLTSSAHISTSNLSEESNDYISKVIAAEIMPSSATEFLDQLSALENISSDPSASIYTTQDMKQLRRDGLLEAHRSMSSMTSLPLTPPVKPQTTATAKEAASSEVIPTPIPAKSSPASTEKKEFKVQSLDNVTSKEVASKKPVNKKQSAATEKPLKAAAQKQEKPKSEERKKGAKSLKVLIPVIILFLAIGGYFAYPHVFPDKKKTRSASTTDTPAKVDNPAAPTDPSDPMKPDTVPEKPDTPAITDGKKIYVTITDMKGLPQDAGTWVLSTEEGEELGELKKDGDKRFGITITQQAFTSWEDQAYILRLRSPNYSIGSLKLRKSEFVESATKEFLESSVDITVSKVVTLSPRVKFAGQDYTESPALLKEYLYSVDINLDIKKEINGDKLSLLVPLETVFPIKAQVTLPGCGKVVRSIGAEGGDILWDIKLSKKTLRIFGLPEFDELKFVPDFSSISDSKIRGIVSSAASAVSLNPRKDVDGYTEIRISKLNGELEIITQNGKQNIDIAANTVAKVISKGSDSYPKNLKPLIESAEAGVQDSQYNLGVKLYEGDGLDKDLASAAGWFILATKQGDGSARNNLAMMYLYGEGIAKNQRKAVELYKIGSDAGDAEASSALGLCYMQAMGVDKNVPEAIKYFEKAAKGDVPRAFLYLGIIYAEKEFGVVDVEKSIESFTKGSEAGHGESSYNLGIIYSGAYGKERKDRAKSILFYQKALKQGYAKAKVELDILGAPAAPPE